MTKLLVSLASFCATAALAAPYPATSSSVLTDPAKGVFFHGFGFRLNNLEPTWAAVPSIGQEVFDSVRFEPRTGGGDSTLSIRMDRLPEKSNLETYARKWMRDYPTYGFDVRGTKTLTLGGGRALLIDMIQKSKNRQLRQVILQKDEKVAILTCMDDQSAFAATLHACNRLIRGFEWADDSRPLTTPSTTEKK